MSRNGLRSVQPCTGGSDKVLVRILWSADPCTGGDVPTSWQFMLWETRWPVELREYMFMLMICR